MREITERAAGGYRVSGCLAVGRKQACGKDAVTGALYDNTEISRIVGAAWDITERRQADEWPRTFADCSDLPGK